MFICEDGGKVGVRVKRRNKQELEECEEMKKAKSVKSETQSKKEVKSPIVTATNHPDKKLLEKSANNKKSSKTQPKKEQPKQVESEAEVKTQKYSWVTKDGWFIRFRFIHPKTKKQRLYYAKSLENLVDRIARLNIKYLVGDIEHFNEKKQKWEIIEEYN